MRNKTITLALFLAGVLPGSPPARAQVLDTLLPPAVPGFGQKFSVIAQHRQSAPGATGWTLDGLTAAPSLGLQAGYDTAPGGSSASTTLQPTASLLLTDDAAGFGLYALADTSRYPQNTAQTLVTAALAGGERIVLPRETLTTAAAVLHGGVTGFAFDTQAITSPIPFTLKTIRGKDEISLSLFTLTPEFALSRYDFSGAGADASRIVPQASLTLGYNSGSPLTALLRTSLAALDYDIPTQNADIFQLLAGAREQEDGLWTFSCLAGAAHRAPAIGPGLTAPVLEARADWMPTTLDEISLTASREIDDPDAISASPYTSSSLKLQITHRYLENVTIRGLADFAAARYIYSNLQEFLATGELDMQWNLTPALMVEGIYRYNTRQANLLSAANEHVVTIGLSWTP